jgi:hypothetical protein
VGDAWGDAVAAEEGAQVWVVVAVVIVRVGRASVSGPVAHPPFREFLVLRHARVVRVIRVPRALS